jgi:hypothetical protein
MRGVMVWRFHFTEADLAQTRVITTLGPLAETMSAVQFVRCPLAELEDFDRRRKLPTTVWSLADPGRPC